MTRDGIIRMAHEAGLCEANGEDDDSIDISHQLKRFAALAAAAERNAILPMLKGIDRTELEDPDGWWETSRGAKFGAGILDAIRARGNV